MASITNTLQMRDTMGSVLKSVITSMNMTISTMERLNTASDNIDLSSDFEAARQQLGLANREISQMDEELQRASQEQQRLNNEMKTSCDIGNRLKGIFASIGGAMAIKKIVETSDTMTQLDARLGLITDDVDGLKSKIQAASSSARGLYIDMASSVAKLGLLAGNAFSNTDEIVKFTETFQKMATVSGSSASEASNAMYQLNQAMASGRLQGDEFRSIIENAPMLANAISEYMGISRTELKELSSDGAITADIIKAAMFSVADDVDKQFEKMPMTWAQVWNGIVNKILQISQPLLEFVSLLAQNWDVLEPIVLGVAAALGGYITALLIYNSVAGISNFIAQVQAARAAIVSGATLTQAAATKTATGAQVGFNAALLACPITWILLAIIGVITALYAVVAVINKVTGSTYSATGIIMGVLTTALAFVCNLFLGLYDLVLGIINALINPFIEIANFIANVFNNPISSVIYLFQGMADSVLGVLQKIASAMDFVFGSNMADTIGGWRAGLKDMADAAVAEYAPDENYQRIMDKLDLSVEGMGLDRWAYGDAWDKGYKFGEGIENKITDKFSTDNLLNDGISLDELTTSLDNQEFDVNVKDDVSLADESLKYLLDSVTQQFINNINVRTPETKVDVNMNIQNANVSDIDYDMVAEKMKDSMTKGFIEYNHSTTDLPASAYQG